MFNAIFPTRKNPYIPGRNAKEVLTTNFSGTEFSIALPPTSNGFASVTDRHLESVDIEDKNIYDNDAEHPFRKGKPWSLTFLVREPTLFAGFMGAKRIGDVTIGGSIWYFDDLPGEMTLFNPVHCEQAVRRLNYFYLGPGSLMDRQYIQPLNWQIVEQNHFHWIYHESTGFNEGEWRKRYPGEELPALASYYNCRYAIPVGERQLLSLVFSFTGYQPVAVALKVLHDLKQECFSTAQLSYSDAAKQKIKSAEHQWPNTTYSTRREPEKWVWHDFYDSEVYEIRKAGSKPPAWQT